MRYAHHRQAVAAPVAKLASAMAFDAFARQFEPAMRDRMTAVYLGALAGTLVEDRRSRGRQIR
jgi:hypothetical protein